MKLYHSSNIQGVLENIQLSQIRPFQFYYRNNNNNNENDDDVKTSSKYKKWLENEEGFNSTLINDLNIAELNFKSTDYDLVLIGFKMSIINGFNLYDKLHKLSKKLEDTPKEIRVCFMTLSAINYKVLAEMYPEFGEECYVSKEVPKDVFIKDINSLIP